MTDFIFLGSKITLDSDCSHEIKRYLLLGRKAMSKLNNIVKNGDVALPTKFCTVRAMVFSVVMCRCESWTIKKTECWRTDDFELWCWTFLRASWTTRRSNQSILKEISPEYSLEGLMLKLKLQYFGHLMRRTGSLEKTLMLGKTEGGRSGQQRMKASLTRLTWVWGNLGRQWQRREWRATPVFLPEESQGRWSLVGCCLWGHIESDTTEVT